MVDIIQKTKKDYNRIAKYFSDTRKYPWDEFILFEKYVKPGQNILDWGCANGRMVLFLEDKKINYFGVDISDRLVNIAKKNFKEKIEQGWAKFYRVGPKGKKFPENFFDIVFMVASFHHLPSEKSRLETLEKIYAQTKKGGKIIISVWNLESDWARRKTTRDWEKMGDSDYLIPWKNPEGKILAKRYYHHFSKEDLKSVLKKAGFVPKKIQYSGQFESNDSKKGKNLIVIAEKK